MWVALREGSSGAESLFGWKLGLRLESWEAACTSRPVVKAFRPAPERIMQRVVGEVERWVKRGGIACHILRSDQNLEEIEEGDSEEIRFDEGIVLFWATDLNMGDIGERVCQIEVLRLRR